MIPQLVQIWRGRLSPLGTRCSTGAPHALQNFIPMERVGLAKINYIGTLSVAGCSPPNGSRFWLELHMIRLPGWIELPGDRMKAIGFFAGAMAIFLAGTTAFADSAILHGSWKGPWYIGMSSGIAVMELAADGSGNITLTNLDEFGAQPVPLAKQTFDGKTFAFTATG